MMTLNDNPRVDAEKRQKQLYKRLYFVSRYNNPFTGIDYDENGMPVRAYLNVHRNKMRQAQRLGAIIRKEIRKVEKFLHSFL